MADDEAQGQQEARARAFLKCLDTLQKSVAKNAIAVDRQTEVTALLYETIGKDKDGLICAIDDLIEDTRNLRAEIQLLRQDLRKFVDAMGTIALRMARSVSQGG